MTKIVTANEHDRKIIAVDSSIKRTLNPINARPASAMHAHLSRISLVTRPWCAVFSFLPHSMYLHFARAIKTNYLGFFGTDQQL